VLGGRAGTWLRQRSTTRRAAAWVLAVAGPGLVTLAALPFRSSVGLGGFLFCVLLVVIADAVIGGVWPAITGVVAGSWPGQSSSLPLWEACALTCIRAWSRWWRS
jgi:hypothetical protein